MAAPAAYTISYFDIRGLAELPRMSLAAAGQEFKDDRVPFVRNPDGTFFRGDWEERKKSAPYGQMPLLTLADGTVIAQSSSILRYLARKLGQVGVSETETALIDAQYEAIQDVRRSYYTARGDAAKTAEFFNKTFPEAFGFIEKNIRGNLYTPASNQFSYGDLAIYYVLWGLRSENAEAVDKVLEANPRCKAIYQAVPEQDKLKAYLAARKETPM